tara:strand:- start:129 stop:584 length:456 start_codon:yes stop_codon:yes gene_type:complete
MILDTFSNIGLYKKFSNDIFSGLNFLKNSKPDISFGVHNISSSLIAIVEEYQTQNQDCFEFESHRRVIDIQYPIVGEERILLSSIKDMTIKKSYDHEKDCIFYTNPKNKPTKVDIGNDTFAIFFENDGHSPKHCVNSPQYIKKITIKVAIR